MNRLHNDARATSRRGADGTFERLYELAVRLADGMDRGLGERGLTRARAELIWLLRREGAMTQRQLSQALRCSPRNVTGLVDGLEQMGLVKREPHATDRRATVVALTSAGSRITAGMEAEYGRAAKEVFADLSAAELKSFSIALEKILGHLRPPPEAPSAPRPTRRVTNRQRVSP